MFPTVTGSGESDFVTDKSVLGLTVVVAVAVLLTAVGSFVMAFAFAVLVSFPSTVGLTLIVTMTLSPLLIVHRLQVTPAWQLPCVEVAETKSTLLGKVSVSFTSVAELGPLFFTVTV